MNYMSNSVTTLALGLRPRQRLARLRAKRKPRSHISCSRECKRMWGNEVSHSQVNSHFWELESKWTPKFSESDCRGQNLRDWGDHYIIRNLLELKCLKWARMTHLNTWNTSYGQKKGRESNYQFDCQSLKVKNRPDFFMCRWCATYH
jgi:hypothetical protein